METSLRRAGRGALPAALVAGVLVACMRTTAPLAMTTAAPVNYIEATPTIASAGMPTRDQLRALAARNRAVINLAPSDAFGSHADERAIVEGAGARYVHVPVDFAAPRPADYERFAHELGALSEQKVFVHCQMNMRASVFVFLYRVLELGDDAERAYDDVLKVWQPNTVWSRFAVTVLKSRGAKLPLALG
jgi:protein tyrosine phosphatase (PTP) superfamily phosphohydrolase (DUF442 family)